MKGAQTKSRGELEHLDTRGTFCPIPILLTARKIRTMAPGEQIEVLGDDPGIVEDMPVWCDETGHRLLLLERSENDIRCIVEKVAS